MAESCKFSTPGCVPGSPEGIGASRPDTILGDADAQRPGLAGVPRAWRVRSLADLLKDGLDSSRNRSPGCTHLTPAGGIRSKKLEPIFVRQILNLRESAGLTPTPNRRDARPLMMVLATA